MEDFKIKLNIDSCGFTSKPQHEVVGVIRNRLCKPERILEITPEELVISVKQGKTFTPAAMKGTKGDSWESQQVICLDIDNDTENMLSQKTAIELLKQKGIVPYFVYSSFSNTEDHPKFRIVLILEQPILDRKKARTYTESLTSYLNSNYRGCADTSVKDNARMFYGSKPDSILCEDKGITPVSLLESLSSGERHKSKDRVHLSASASSSAEESERIIEALGFIPSDNYETWIKVGMALKNEGLDVSVWDDWMDVSETLKK